MKRKIPKSITEKFEKKYIFDLSEEYKDGRLIMISFPYWQAFVCAEESDFWVRIFPLVNLTKGVIEVTGIPKEEKIPHSKGTLFEQDQTKFLKCNNFLELLPTKIRRLTERFKESHWNIVETLILLGEDFETLITVNPAMAYLIVNLGKVNSSFELSNQKELLDRLIRTKQKDILGLANLPATENLRRIFLKIEIGDVTEKQFVHFCKLIPKEGDESKRLLKLLSHLGTINSSVMQLVSYNRKLLFGLSKNIIVELCKADDNSESIKLLKRISARCKSVEIPFPKVKLLADLPQIDRDNFEQAKQKKLLLEQFPKPPLKGNEVVIPLLNAREQSSWSKKQANCIRGYSGKVKSSRSFFYKVIYKKEEATLEIKIDKDKIKLGDLLGRQNKKVSAKLKDYVHEWFSASIDRPMS